MSSISTTDPARKPSRPRPERRMTLGAPSRNGVRALKLTVGKTTAGYYVLPMPCELPGVAYRLVKFDQDVKPGEADHYDLRLVSGRVTDSTCECAGFLKHGWHRTPDGKLVSCKHLDSCIALGLGKPTTPAPATLTPSYRCTACRENPVDAEGGEDTCPECLAKA
jgi:hypothetical protein